MPEQVASSETSLARFRQRLADRGAAQQLRAAEASADTGRRGRGVPALLAVSLATLVHASTLALAAAGVLILWQAHWLLKPGGLLLLLIVAAVLPRLSLPDAEVELDRDGAPHLYALVDRVADFTGAPTPGLIRLDTSFNAYVAGTRRRVLTLGVPLWVASSPQAKVAILGHELGHFAHGDLLDGWYVGRAAITLDQWIWLVDDRLDEGWAWLEGEGGVLSQSLLSIAYAPLRLGFSGVLRLLLLLNATASRRREYLADIDAIRAGGSEAAADGLHDLLAVEAVAAALTRAALGPRRGEPWAVVVEALERVDQQGRQNRLRVAEAERSRVDDSHPLTSLRVRLVEARPRASAGVVIDTDETARLEAELAPHVEAVGQRITEMIRYTS